MTKFEDKYHLTPDENRRLAKSNLARLVFANTRFEGLTTTLPQTETIVSGLGVDGVSIDDINTTVQLKRGWQYIIEEEAPLSLQVERNINAIVARDDALFPGELRSGNGAVATYKGEYMPPERINSDEEEHYLNELLGSDRSTTDKALTLMFHNMKSQIFWDGNKRSATLAANKLMIENGAGLIAIPVDQYPTFLTKIADYYHSDDMEELKQWTYENGIQGVEPKQEKNFQNSMNQNLRKYLESQNELDR